MNLRDALLDIMRTVWTPKPRAGKVTGVEERVCDVEPTDGGAPMLDVKLSFGTGGVTVKPKEGSQVSVLEFGRYDGIIGHVSDPESVTIQVDNTLVFVDATGVKIERGGESLTALLQDLIGAINALTVTTAVGPSGPPINIAQFQTISTRINNLLI